MREDEHLLVEFAVRSLCALDFRNVTAEPDAIVQALSIGIEALKARNLLQKLAEFIGLCERHPQPL